MQTLENLSHTDKLKLMEALWTDLSVHASEFASPDWHAEALDDAQQAVADGEAQFMDWAEAKRQLRGK